MSMRIPFFSRTFNRIRQVPLLQSHEAASSETGQDAFSCKTKKNVPWHILVPSAVACDMFSLRASAHHWHVSAFFVIGNFKEFPITKKRQLRINNCLHHTVFNTQSAVSLLLTPS